jgi:hypothetical protein
MIQQNGGEVWLGYNDRTQPGVWTWSDGSPVHYEYWADDNRTMHCTFMQLGDGRWHVDNCRMLRPLLCKMSAGKRVSGTCIYISYLLYCYPLDY